LQILLLCLHNINSASEHTPLIVRSEPLYIKASKASAVSDLKSGVVTVDDLRRTGDAFTNVTQVRNHSIHLNFS
jgi:hypothetical protein